MPAKKKASAVDNLNARLSLVVKSGKISLGHRTTVKALRKSQGERPRTAPPPSPPPAPRPRSQLLPGLRRLRALRTVGRRSLRPAG